MVILRVDRHSYWPLIDNVGLTHGLLYQTSGVVRVPLTGEAGNLHSLASEVCHSLDILSLQEFFFFNYLTTAMDIRLIRDTDGIILMGLENRK